MIACLTGKLVSKTSTSIIIDVAGVGYMVSMPTSSLALLPQLGDSATIFTYLNVREDELSLFGFSSEEEKETFQTLIGVSGIGPKVALAALSTLSPGQLAHAVESEDLSRIVTIPGVGKKVASRLLLELKGRLTSQFYSSEEEFVSQTGTAGSVIAALAAMGFSENEAFEALVGYDGSIEDEKKALRYALQHLGAR